MKKLLFVGLLLVLVAMPAIAKGVDDRGNVNDPAVNERANACYEGGTMAGQCETDLAWSCGWYIIRAQFGIFMAEQVPAACLPQQQPVQPAVPSVSGCLFTGVSNNGVDYYFLFNGGYTQGQIPPQAYGVYDSTCTSIITTFFAPYVYAPYPYDPETLCNTAFNRSASLQTATDIWACA